jgi:hypothetical protein
VFTHEIASTSLEAEWVIGAHARVKRWDDDLCGLGPQTHRRRRPSWVIFWGSSRRLRRGCVSRLPKHDQGGGRS